MYANIPFTGDLDDPPTLTVMSLMEAPIVTGKWSGVVSQSPHSLLVHMRPANLRQQIVSVRKREEQPQMAILRSQAGMK